MNARGFFSDVTSRVRGAMNTMAGFGASKVAPSIYEIGFSNSPFAGGIPRRNVALWLREYGRNPHLRAPVHRVALDCAAVRWRMFRHNQADPRSPIEVFGHPLMRMMFGSPIGKGPGRPNPWMSCRQMRRLDRVYREIAGEAFLWIRRDRPHGPPLELWPIPPHWVTSIPGLKQTRTGEIVFDPMFRFSFAGGAQEMLMTEIIWRYDQDPANPYWRGIGPAQAVDDEVSQLSFMAKFNNSFFRNNARPDVIVSVEGARDTELKRMEEWWASRHAGFSKSFIPAFMNEKTSVSVLGATTHNDMQFSAMHKITRDVVRQNWNVPPELIGDIADSNRGKTDSALRAHMQLNIVPRCDDDAEDWNYYLLPLFDEHPDLEPGFDTNGLFLAYDSPVQETNDFILKRANEGLTRGAWTVDEYRIETGRQPLPDGAGGNERLVPVNVVVTLPDGSMATGPNQSQDGAPVAPPKFGDSERITLHE